MTFGDELRAARRQRGWSYARLTGALKEEAQRQGVGIMSDRSMTTALSRWENNHNTPDRFYRRLLGAVLGLLDPDDLAARTSTYEPNVDRAIEALSVMTRRDRVEEPVLASSAGLVHIEHVISGYLFAHSYSVDERYSRAESSVVEPNSVAERIRVTASTLMDIDFDQGGGNVRGALTDYFRLSVVPELRVARPSALRRAVFAAAAEVAQLLGWSAYDAGHQAVAARYFTLGLRLADEAADHLMGARLLANLSHQYNSLGKFPQALTAARAAQAALRGHGTPSVETMCVMMEARALASVRDERGATLAIDHAERLFKRRAGNEPAWISYYDAAELAGDSAHAFRDLGAAAQTREFAEAALTASTPRRTRAFIQLVSADAALACGELEQAAALAVEALESGSDLRSQRYLRYLESFARAVPDLRHPVLARFTDIVSDRHPDLFGETGGGRSAG